MNAPEAAAEQRFSTMVSVDRQGRTHVPVPFDPDDVWGAKPRHHVTGSVAGRGLRGVVDRVAGGRVVVLGPAWSGGCGPADGEVVEVVLAPEGPQRGDLAPTSPRPSPRRRGPAPSSTPWRSSTARPT